MEHWTNVAVRTLVERSRKTLIMSTSTASNVGQQLQRLPEVVYQRDKRVLLGEERFGQKSRTDTSYHDTPSSILSLFFCCLCYQTNVVLSSNILILNACYCFQMRNLSRLSALPRDRPKIREVKRDTMMRGTRNVRCSLEKVQETQAITYGRSSRF